MKKNLTVEVVSHVLQTSRLEAQFWITGELYTLGKLFNFF